MAERCIFHPIVKKKEKRRGDHCRCVLDSSNCRGEKGERFTSRRGKKRGSSRTSVCTIAGWPAGVRAKGRKGKEERR